MPSSFEPSHSVEFELKHIWDILKPITSKDLPILPTNVLEWIAKARPNIGNRTRNFDQSPYWIDIYEDNHPNILVTAARQLFKTTACTDIIACAATSHSGKEVSYVVDNEDHLSAFSMQRFRRETFLANPVLKQFLPHGRANIGVVTLLNGSVIYLMTDESEYKKVEGKSNYILVTDETQYQDVQFFYKALYTLSQTHGKVIMFGIGGEAGSEYHKLWQRTDQREWIYDDPYWREKLAFDAGGNITNTDLKQILAGRWVALKPENTQYRGYHLPQTISPTIPLTIEDAILKYNIQSQLSIEHQRRYFPKSIYESHTLGQFFKAERRPITPEMVEACYVRYLPLLKPADLEELKITFGNEIRILGGVDFGSSTVQPTTVASVIIHWKKSHRFQLAYIEKIEQGRHPYDKARHIVEIFRSYHVDTAVGDIGHGQDMIPVIQDGGRDSSDIRFEGLGRNRFLSCRTVGDPTKPEQRFQLDVDDDGRRQLGRIQIDKTTTIQNFIDFIGTYVAHPTRPQEEQWKRTQFIIPFQNDWETDWLLNDFVSITRADLEQDPDVAKEDPRQKAIKLFNHPADSIMSIIYCLVADKHNQDGAYRVFGAGGRKLK